MVVNLYKITHIKSGKVYVGKTTKDVFRRFRTHCRYAKGTSRMVICRAIRKYGPRQFRTEWLGFCLSNDAANLAERALIQYYKQRGPTYNSTDGGDGAIGYKWTDAQCQNLSRAMCGRPMTWAKKIHATLKKSSVAWKKSISDGMQQMPTAKKLARIRKIQAARQCKKAIIGANISRALKQSWKQRKAMRRPT